jgi:hypothetical protein
MRSPCYLRIRLCNPPPLIFSLMRLIRSVCVSLHNILDLRYHLILCESPLSLLATGRLRVLPQFVSVFYADCVV